MRGDIDSPIIFNIVVDAIIRDIAASGDYNYEVLLKSFYADDGASCDTDPAKVQSLANAFKDRFERVGLEMNDIKTKAMIVIGRRLQRCNRRKHLIDYIKEKARLIVNAHWRRFNANSVVLCRRDRDSSSISQGKFVRAAERHG